MASGRDGERGNPDLLLQILRKINKLEAEMGSNQSERWKPTEIPQLVQGTSAPHVVPWRMTSGPSMHEFSQAIKHSRCNLISDQGQTFPRNESL